MREVFLDLLLLNEMFLLASNKHFYEPAERVQISANVIKDEYDLQF